MSYYAAVSARTAYHSRDRFDICPKSGPKWKRIVKKDVTSAVVSEIGTRRERVINDGHSSLKTGRVEHDTALSCVVMLYAYYLILA